MDNLPKDQDSDISAFAGSYPEKQPESAKSEPTTASPAGPVTGPASGEAAGQTPVPKTEPAAGLVSGEQLSQIPESLPQEEPVSSTVGPETPPPFATTEEAPPAATGDATAAPFMVSETIPEQSSPGEITGQEAAPEPSVSPTAGQAPLPAAPKKANGMLKRILLLLILLVVILGLGFAAFRILGRFMSRNQPVTLTYWGLWEDEGVLRPIIDEYKKSHPDTEIVYTKQSPRQYRERLQAALERGEGPDIFRFHAAWVPMLKNVLAPAGSTGYISSEFSETFYPAATKDLVIGNKVYGVPLMIDGLGLYYNEDLFRAAGVTPPTSWNSFLEAARTLTVKDQTGKIVTSGAALGTTSNVEHFSDIVALMMFQNGANLKNPISKEAQDALTFYRLFAEAPNNVWDETLDNSIIAFASGRVAMIFAPSWQVFTIKEANPELKFQIIPVPQLPGTQVAWASYWAEGVAVDSKNVDAAWEFLKFLSGKEQLTILYTEQAKQRLFGEPYSRVDLAQTLINDPLVGAYIKQAPTAQSFFLSSRTFDNGINDRLIKYTEDGINSLAKGVSIEAVLETMSKGYSQVLSSYSVSTTAP